MTLTTTDPVLPARTPGELAALARAVAARPELWAAHVRFDADRRWYALLDGWDDEPAHAEAAEVWLLTWLPGQATRIHDHGGAAGAFTVVAGALTERTFALNGEPAEPAVLRLGPGAVREFGPRHVHEVANRDAGPAVSIHAYAPRLAWMSYYQHVPGAPLRLVGSERVDAEPPRPAADGDRRAAGVEALLEGVRARLRRLDPRQAAAAVAAGAVLVDTRPAFQRHADGEMPWAVIVERNHLEWRLDPGSSGRIPEAVDRDVEWIVVCDAGYASSLAAAQLQGLGLTRATDLVGGFRAWRAAGLPVTPPGAASPPRLAAGAEEPPLES